MRKKNIIQYVTANYATIYDKIIAARITKVDAITKALNNTRNLTYTQLSGSPSAEYVEMVYVKNKTGDFVLAFKIAVKTGTDLQYYYIDAVAGELLMKEFTTCNVNAPGTGQTLYSGNRPFIGDQQGVQFRLSQVRNNVQINTLNNNFSNNETGTVATDFWDNDNNWLIAEHPNDRAALDVHWATQNVFDYWLTVHNRNSIDNNGMTINSYVHWGNNANNAMWRNISPFAMFYGDGDGFLFRSFGALDICGHELGHGICQFTSNLIYSTAESGALNEGFSDIWGATIENWTDPTKQTWLMGEEITIVNPGFIRNMSNPNQAPFNWQQPDTYLGTNWGNLSNDPHINSGVLNFWYFLLSQGGNGVNDIGNAYNVTGIGIANAARIAYATEQNLLSGDGYIQARNISIQRTRQLFGIGSCEEVAVTRAWFAVGVGANYSGTPNIPINGSPSFCSGSETYNIGIGSGTVTSWTVTPQNIVNWVPNGNSITLTKIQDGIVTLTATIQNACGTTQNSSAIKTIPVGFPYFSNAINGADTATPYGHYTFSQPLPWGYPIPSNYYWRVPTGWSILSGQGTSNVYVQAGGLGEGGPVEVDVTACGLTRLNHKYVEIGYSNCNGCIPDRPAPGGGKSDYSVKISPNPARTTAVVTLIPVSEKQKHSSYYIQQIKIADKMGSIKKQLSFNNRQLPQTINISGLPPDIYVVSVYDGHYWQNVKLIVQ